MTVTETIISPAIQYAIVSIMGAIAGGIFAIVKLMFSQRKKIIAQSDDIKKVLSICMIFSENINTLNPCVKKILSVAKFHNTAINEVVRQDDETAIQSLHSAMDDIREVECMLDKRYDANSEAAVEEALNSTNFTNTAYIAFQGNATD